MMRAQNEIHTTYKLAPFKKDECQNEEEEELNYAFCPRCAIISTYFYA